MMTMPRLNYNHLPKGRRVAKATSACPELSLKRGENGGLNLFKTIQENIVCIVAVIYFTAQIIRWII